MHLETSEKIHLVLLFVLSACFIMSNVCIIKYWFILEGNEYTNDLCRRISCNFTSNYTSANGLFFVPTLNRSVEVTVYLSNRKNYCGYQGNIECYYKKSDPDGTLKLGQNYMNSAVPALIIIDMVSAFGLLTYVILWILTVYRRKLREERYETQHLLSNPNF